MYHMIGLRMPTPKPPRQRRPRPKTGSGAAKERRAARIAANGGTFTPEEWLALVEKCGNRCLRCGSDSEKLVADHVTPLYRGGLNGIENIQPLCYRCNLWKGIKTIDYRPN